MKEFHSQYVALNRPVVIRGGANQWKCSTAWQNLSYIRGALGGVEVFTETFPNRTSRDFCSMIRSKRGFGSRSMNSYLDHVESNISDHQKYIMLNEMDFMSRGGDLMDPGFRQFADDFPVPHKFLGIKKAYHRRSAFFLVKSSY